MTRHRQTCAENTRGVKFMCHSGNTLSVCGSDLLASVYQDR